MAALEPNREPDRADDKIPWVRIAFGLAAIWFIAYCVYLGHASPWGLALILTSMRYF
jgi:hypothetical protein